MTEFVFVKSTYSGGDAGQQCVEVARNVPGVVAVRDSKFPCEPVLRITSGAWELFAVCVGKGAGRAGGCRADRASRARDAVGLIGEP